MLKKTLFFYKSVKLKSVNFNSQTLKLKMALKRQYCFARVLLGWLVFRQVRLKHLYGLPGLFLR